MQLTQNPPFSERVYCAVVYRFCLRAAGGAAAATTDIATTGALGLIAAVEAKGCRLIRLRLLG